VPELDETWLRFVDGRPVRPITRRAFFRGAPESSKRLARGRWFSSGTKRLLARLQGGLRRWLLASTTEKKSKRERERERERESGSEAGVRIVRCLLAKQSPWLNAIEPK
jgi:hypothetical protein